MSLKNGQQRCLLLLLRPARAAGANFGAKIQQFCRFSRFSLNDAQKCRKNVSKS
jgi:hypothetical protein